MLVPIPLTNWAKGTLCSETQESRVIFSDGYLSSMALRLPKAKMALFKKRERKRDKLMYQSHFSFGQTNAFIVDLCMEFE